MKNSTIIFADWDDPDIKDFCLSSDVLWIRLGLNDSKYSINLNASGWSLTADGITITDLDLIGKRVIFRRWRSSPPRPIICCTDGFGDLARLYLENQWESVFLSLLSLSYKKNSEGWSRPPYYPWSKVDFYCKLSGVVNVPEWCVSLKSDCLEYEDLVFKSIANNQCINEGQRVSTMYVSRSLDTELQPAPVLFQQRISHQSELRVGFAYGIVSIVEITPIDNSGEQISDFRYAMEVKRKSIVSESISAEARKISEILSLQMYTADIIVGVDGKLWWCDINPDGLFLALDDENRTFEKQIKTILSCE